MTTITSTDDTTGAAKLTLGDEAERSLSVVADAVRAAEEARIKKVLIKVTTIVSASEVHGGPYNHDLVDKLDETLAPLFQRAQDIIASSTV